MILVIFSKEYAQKSSMEVMVHFLMIMVIFTKDCIRKFLYGAPGLFPYDSGVI